MRSNCLRDEITMTTPRDLRYPRKNAPVRPEIFVLHTALDTAATNRPSGADRVQPDGLFRPDRNRRVRTGLCLELSGAERSRDSGGLRLAILNGDVSAHQSVASAWQHADPVSTRPRSGVDCWPTPLPLSLSH